MASFSFFPNNQVKLICDFSINVIERERDKENTRPSGGFSKEKRTK